MTTSLLPPTTNPAGLIRPSDVHLPIEPLRFTTLTSVEARKMTDTRSGRGVLAAIVGLVALVLGWKVSHPTIETSFANYGGAVTTVVAVLVPVLGLLAMTAEWTQRTALTTFTLAPRRLAVLAAKLTAAIALALMVWLVAMVLALGATAIAGAVHGHAVYAGAAGDLRGGVTIVVLQVVMGAAFGALAGQTAVALGAYLLAPNVWGIVSQQVLKGASPWFDVFAAYNRLASAHPFDHVAQSVTSVTLWVILPCLLGVLRCLRREVK